MIFKDFIVLKKTKMYFTNSFSLMLIKP